MGARLLPALVRTLGRLVKRAFGLVTILLGVAFLAYGIGQKWLSPGASFSLLVLLVNLAWTAALFYFGSRWLLNVVKLDVMTIDPDGPEMAEAKRRARASLGRFWELLAQNRYECSVRFALPGRRGSGRRVWAPVLSRTEQGVVLSLAEESYAELDYADECTVPLADIEDWQVVVSKMEIHGGYSWSALGRIAKSRGQRPSCSDRRMLRALVDTA